MSIQLIQDFEYGYWLSTLETSLTYAIFAANTALGQQILIQDYNFDEMAASQLLTTPSIILVLLMPVIGLFSDRFGNRMTVLLASNLVQVFIYSIPVMVD